MTPRSYNQSPPAMTCHIGTRGTYYIHAFMTQMAGRALFCSLCHSRAQAYAFSVADKRAVAEWKCMLA